MSKSPLSFEDSKKLMLFHQKFVPFGTVMCISCRAYKNKTVGTTNQDEQIDKNLSDRIDFWNSSATETSPDKPSNSEQEQSDKNLCDFAHTMKEHENYFLPVFKGNCSEDRLKLIYLKSNVEGHTERFLLLLRSGKILEHRKYRMNICSNHRSLFGKSFMTELNKSRKKKCPFKLSDECFSMQKIVA